MQFEKSADTKILENVLAEAKVGQTFTYSELSAAIGRDVREHALASLRTARRGVLKSKGFVFAVERDIGLVRLDDVGILKSMEFDRRRLQRGAKRSLRKLTVVDFENLAEEDKRKHIVASAQMGAIAMFSHKTASRKIESHVTTHKQLPIGETLKMFGA